MPVPTKKELSSFCTLKILDFCRVYFNYWIYLKAAVVINIMKPRLLIGWLWIISGIALITLNLPTIVVWVISLFLIVTSAFFLYVSVMKLLRLLKEYNM